MIESLWGARCCCRQCSRASDSLTTYKACVVLEPRLGLSRYPVVFIDLSSAASNRSLSHGCLCRFVAAPRKKGHGEEGAAEVFVCLGKIHPFLSNCADLLGQVRAPPLQCLGVGG